jgi:hypothetical protein
MPSPGVPRDRHVLPLGGERVNVLGGGPQLCLGHLQQGQRNALPLPLPPRTRCGGKVLAMVAGVVCLGGDTLSVTTV